ncbi:peptidase [Sphingomonas sp.]|uniref:peptidase n=1 Tax=Sphingomonas sp. TaxID=28214 RepID=UPI003BACC70C
MFRLCWAALSLIFALARALARLPRQAAVALGGEQADQPARPRRLLLALATALPVSLGGAWVLPRITLVMSPSVDAWIVSPAPGTIHKGDLVQFMLSHPAVGPQPVSATKYALCLPGERLTLVEQPAPFPANRRTGHFYCNGSLLGVSFPVGPRGLRLEHARWHGVIPPGYVYVGSRHPRGFDSRYVGLVPLTALQRMRRLL